MTKTTVPPPMLVVSQSVAIVPPYLPANQGWHDNSVLALTTDDSKRRPDGEHYARLDSATP